jgi:eukaryotic-like serine/threonine-protein kinase
VRARELALADRDPMVGRTLEGRYTILARLGSGSMGTVYRARQHAMGREVAIKILRGDRAIDETAKARFMREARANSLLASPNTVTVFDFGQSESGEFYLAMEILEGESLGQRLTRLGKLEPAVAVDVARQALRSLAEAHAKGIIHRDLKPDNLFFARVLTGPKPHAPTKGPVHEEIVKVLDFGIAKMMNAAGDEPMGVVETQAGTVFGTPRYMSPEQAQGKPLDARTDLYSLGVILYQMLTGRPPFTDNDAVVVMARHIKSVPKRPNEAVPEAHVPKELEDVVMRSLAKDPKDRQPDAETFAGELLAAIEGLPAATSGVRSAMNVAGIRLPDSMRPPPVPLPPPPRNKLSSSAIAAMALPVVLLVAAGAVYLGMRNGKTAPAPPLPVTVASAPVSAPPQTPAPATGETSTPSPPTTSIAALPGAPDTDPKPSASGKAIHGKTGRPPKVTPTTTRTHAEPSPPTHPPTATTTAPQTTTTSSYGVFE